MRNARKYGQQQKDRKMRAIVGQHLGPTYLGGCQNGNRSRDGFLSDDFHRIWLRKETGF